MKQGTVAVETTALISSCSVERRVPPPDWRIRSSSLSAAVVLTILLGVSNFVCLKVMYTTYGLKYAYFASQAVNLLYVVFGGLPLLYCIYCSKSISKDERTTSKRKFVYMGLMDSIGTFLTAYGSVGVSSSELYS